MPLPKKLSTLERQERRKKQRAFKKKLDELLKKANKLDDDGVKSVFKLLSDTQQRLTLAINNAALDGWDATHLPRVKQALNRVIADFQGQYGKQLTLFENNAFELGQKFVDDLVLVKNEMFALPMMSTETLAIWQGYSADLVVGLTGDMRRWLNSELTLGITGEKSPFELVKTLGKRIKGYEWEKGTFYNKAWRRAEVITRTEINRVLNLSKQAREQQLKDVHPEAVKYWVTTSTGKGARQSHKRVEQETNPDYGGTPIKLDEFYNVAGYSAKGPHDSGLPASEVIQCGCVSVTTFPEFLESE